VHFLIYVQIYRNWITVYVWVISITKVSNSTSDLQTCSRSLALIPFDRPYMISYFSTLGKLADRAIYFTFRSFYLFLSSFLMISRRQIISRSAGPIFTIFTSNESFLGVDDRSGTLFSISQGTLPWQPILCKNGAKLPTPCTYRSVIQKRYGLTPCLCKIK